MTVKELKEKLNSLPEECDSNTIVFGMGAYGEEINVVKDIGASVEIGCW